MSVTVFFAVPPSPSSQEPPHRRLFTSLSVSNSFAQPVLQFTSAPPTAGTFVLYARKSTEGEDRQVQSIDDQTRHCQALANAHGLPLAFQITEARSAKRHGARPGFREMIERVEAGEVDGILAWHPDRLARNAIDGGWILDLLDRGKLRHLRFAAYTFENTPEGKMMLGMIFSQAKYQVDKLAVDVRRGMNTKREQGWFPHRVGEGYKNDLESHTILVDPLRFPLLRQAVELILAGTHRPSEALRVLNDTWGYQTRPTRRGGGGPLSRSGFYHVLSNPFYYGECRERGVIYPGAHPPLMSRAEFRQVQERLATKGQAKPKVHSHAFTGLIRCGRCGSAVTASRAKGHVYYHCTDRLRVCTKSGIRAEALEGQFLTHFDKLTIPAWLEPLLVEATCRNLAQEPVRAEQAEAGQQAALAAAEKELRALTRMRLRELLTDQEFLEEKARLQKEMAGLEQQTASKNSEALQEAKTAACVMAYATWAREAFVAAEPAEQRRLAGLLGARHLLADRKLTVEMNPYLALLTEHHEVLQALGEQPSAEKNSRIEGSSKPERGIEQEPIKPGKTGSGSLQTSFHTAAVSGGPKERVQTTKNGSGSTKKAFCEETVFAGRAGEAMFKLIHDVGENLAFLIREREEAFRGEVFTDKV